VFAGFFLIESTSMLSSMRVPFGPFPRNVAPFTARLTAGLRASLLLVILASSATQAAETAAAPATAPRLISIDDLVMLVLQHNPGLRAGQRGVDVATAGVTTAGAIPNPRIEINAGRNGTPSPSAQTGNVTGIGVSQFIENPNLRSARVNTALYAEQSSLQSLSQTRNELVGQVRQRAYEYLLRKEEALAAADALGLLEQIRERVKVRVETGEAGRYELIKSDAEIINAQQREQTARLQIQQAAISLNRLAAGQLPPVWDLDAQLNEVIALPELDQLKKSALQSNPELRVLESEFERNTSRIAEAQASRLPGLELRLSQIREPDVRQDILGVSVQVPLFDQRRGPRAEAIAERERTTARLEGRRAELIQQLELSWKSVEIARVRIKALSEGAMRDAEAALRVAQAAYRFGERGILEVLDAQRVLRAVRQDLLLARYQLQASLIDLDVLAGRYASPNQ
jgi:cobalt-zinc-cadmium efflux system outer membrane protein